MPAQARRIRASVRRQQTLNAGTAVRYPEPLRRQVLAYVKRRQQAGDSLKSITRRLGLRPQLLFYWQKKTPNRVLRRVTIAPGGDPAPARRPHLVLLAPRGLRVEGLDVDSLAALLEALS